MTDSVPPAGDQELDHIRRIIQRALDGILALFRQLHSTPAFTENVTGVARIVGELGDCKAASRAQTEFPREPSQSWLPDTFIERAYGIALNSKLPVNEVVMLTAFEASAIRQRMAQVLRPPVSSQGLGEDT